jgi:hypothetical protein
LTWPGWPIAVAGPALIDLLGGQGRVMFEDITSSIEYVTLPAPIGDIAYQNKTVIYDILFKASAETTLTIAADPKRLGARIGITSVLYTWGSAPTPGWAA